VSLVVGRIVERGLGERGLREGVSSSCRVASVGSLASLGVVSSGLIVGRSGVLVELRWASKASSSGVGCSYSASS